jgi:hypothetical protein
LITAGGVPPGSSQEGNRLPIREGICAWSTEKTADVQSAKEFAPGQQKKSTALKFTASSPTSEKKELISNLNF